jgi:hypothetical protein
VTTATKTEKSYGFETLERLPKGTTLYTILRHVSASGLTRWMSVCYFQDNEPRWIRVEEHNAYLKVGWNSLDHGADYKVRGTGMDMGFGLVYELGQLIHGDGYYFNQRWL